MQMLFAWMPLGFQLGVPQLGLILHRIQASSCPCRGGCTARGTWGNMAWAKMGRCWRPPFMLWRVGGRKKNAFPAGSTDKYLFEKADGSQPLPYTSGQDLRKWALRIYCYACNISYTWPVTHDSYALVVRTQWCMAIFLYIHILLEATKLLLFAFKKFVREH